jgi:hypothetical protein
MLEVKQSLPNAFGSFVAEQHNDETRSSVLPREDSSAGIAFVWAGFYAVIAIAAMLHYVGHHHA